MLYNSNLYTLSGRGWEIFRRLWSQFNISHCLRLSLFPSNSHSLREAFLLTHRSNSIGFVRALGLNSTRQHCCCVYSSVCITIFALFFLLPPRWFLRYNFSCFVWHFPSLSLCLTTHATLRLHHHRSPSAVVIVSFTHRKMTSLYCSRGVVRTPEVVPQVPHCQHSFTTL